MTPGDDASTRAVYDATASLYAELVGTEVDPSFEGPVDRSLLSAFAELASAGAGPVVDLGCGPGRVAAHLAGLGLDTVGIDISAAMLAVGRRAHPGISFLHASLDALPFRTGRLGGAVSWYSIIHTAPARLDGLFSEIARVVRPGGHVLVAFQSGTGDRVDRPDAHGSGLTLSRYRHSPDTVGRALAGAGLRVRARVEREADLEHETTPQAFLLARR